MEGAYQVGREDPPQGFVVQGRLSAPSHRLIYTRCLRRRPVIFVSLLRKSYATINIPLYQSFGLQLAQAGQRFARHVTNGWFCTSRFSFGATESPSRRFGLIFYGYVRRSHCHFSWCIWGCRVVYGLFILTLLVAPLLRYFGFLYNHLGIRCIGASSWIPMHLDTCWRKTTYQYTDARRSTIEQTSFASSSHVTSTMTCSLRIL
jgi:hypothetical protein